ncbi:MAG TPA: Nramp family divalent metal transporter, partial [Bryobacteraceae bacterium]|nr:Nramp family divalent metal transporter [Bryobacteraceae bacterium]
LGAEVGYTAMWIILLSCVIKPAVQSEFGRYIIATGETGAEAFRHVPGPKIRNVSWMVWAWAFMTLITWFQIGAMFGGVAQVLNQLVPAVPVVVWIPGLCALSLMLLLGGGYSRIEHLATIKVALFTLLTLLCALVLVQQPERFSWEQIRQGLQFQLPGAGIATAVAVFGITGVGASELFMYPYWCVEKGYARYTGKRDGTPAWEARARGWIRVMNVDILASMVVYCVATVAFYLLGAGILHAQGLVPSAHDMIPILSNMYTQTLGPWALWLFYAGAIATLYGTIFAATAGNSRVLADLGRIMGKFERGDYEARVRLRNKIIWFHLIVPIVLFYVFRNPVTMVKAGGVAQACMLPLLSVAALYLRFRGLPREAAPGPIATVGLCVAATVIVAVMAYSTWLTVATLL